jgi:hypothetical protein
VTGRDLAADQAAQGAAAQAQPAGRRLAVSPPPPQAFGPERPPTADEAGLLSSFACARLPTRWPYCASAFCSFTYTMVAGSREITRLHRLCSTAGDEETRHRSRCLSDAVKSRSRHISSNGVIMSSRELGKPADWGKPAD